MTSVRMIISGARGIFVTSLSDFNSSNDEVIFFVSSSLWNIPLKNLLYFILFIQNYSAVNLIGYVLGEHKYLGYFVKLRRLIMDTAL